MVRRNSWRKLVLAAFCLMPVGCETLHSWLHKDDGDKMASSDSNDDSNSKIIGSSPDDQDFCELVLQEQPAGGGLELGGPEIERDLGAY